MSSQDKRGQSGKRRDRYVLLFHWLMRTEAWQSLSGNQRAIYIEMAMRYAGPGSTNGLISYSVREGADSLRIGRSTAANDLKVLQDRGFIVMMTKGAFSVKSKRATTWRLTEFHCDVTHTAPTKEFTRWTREIQNTVQPQSATVPVAGSNGTFSRPDMAEMSRNGAGSGTVKPVFVLPRDLKRDTYSLPGEYAAAEAGISTEVITGLSAPRPKLSIVTSVPIAPLPVRSLAMADDLTDDRVADPAVKASKIDAPVQLALFDASVGDAA